MFEEEAEERTKQYMNKHTEKYNCENTKLETDNYNTGREYGYEDGFQDGAEFGYNKASEWHYVMDKLPPNPKESEDGKHIRPLNYICAYDCGDGDYECDEFTYLGNGVWLGENKDYYPIYAWLEGSVEVPPPRKE